MKLLKQMVKATFPGLVYLMRDFRRRWRRWRMAWLHVRDAFQSLEGMNWVDGRGLYHLEAELFFQFHKIEKGMCMPSPKRFFGVDAIRKTLDLIVEWEDCGGDVKAPAYLGAVEAVRAYERYIHAHRPGDDVAEWLFPRLQAFLSVRSVEHPEFQTPIDQVSEPEEAVRFFSALMLARRSVRDYSEKFVPEEIVAASVRLAGLSPSACNRQPWRVHSYVNKAQIRELLGFQNGNSGFGHLLNRLLIITADRASFFDASERNEPYVDGGLFAMSLILALQSHGVSSCCLNWCVDANSDEGAHQVGGISDREIIVMYMAVGYSVDHAQVPRSPRKDLSSILIVH